LKKIRDFFYPLTVMVISAAVLWLFGKGLVQILHWAYGAFGKK
jgi:hypothetical protein